MRSLHAPRVLIVTKLAEKFIAGGDVGHVEVQGDDVRRARRLTQTGIVRKERVKGSTEQSPLEVVTVIKV